MIPLNKYPHIPYWFTLRQAVAELEKTSLEINGLKSLPRALLVFDEKYLLLGIVRRRDILRGLEPNFLRHLSVSEKHSSMDIKIDPNLIEMSSCFDSLSKAIKKQADVVVSEVMQPIVATVNADDHLAKIIYIMIEQDLNLISVLENEKVVGVVCSVGVFHQIANVLL